MENEVLDALGAEEEGGAVHHARPRRGDRDERPRGRAVGRAGQPPDRRVHDRPRRARATSPRCATTPRFVELHKAIWAVLREEVLKGYAQQLQVKAATWKQRRTTRSVRDPPGRRGRPRRLAAAVARLPELLRGSTCRRRPPTSPGQRLLDPAEPMHCALARERRPRRRPGALHRTPQLLVAGELAATCRTCSPPPDQRGQGVGRALIEHVYAQAPQLRLRQGALADARDATAPRMQLYDRIAEKPGFVQYRKDALITGPPPCGNGSPPARRTCACGRPACWLAAVRLLVRDDDARPAAELHVRQRPPGGLLLRRAAAGAGAHLGLVRHRRRHLPPPGGDADRDAAGLRHRLRCWAWAAACGWR